MNHQPIPRRQSRSRNPEENWRFEELGETPLSKPDHLLRIRPRIRNNSNSARIAVCAVAIALCSATPVSAAADNLQVVSFAKENHGKYASELVPSPKVSIESKLTLRGVMVQPEIWQMYGAAYDPEKQIITMGAIKPLLRSISSLTIEKRCKAGAPFVGQNAYGAKVNVRSESCDNVFFSLKTAIPITGLSFAATPDQYRAIQSGGLNVEFDATLTVGKDGTVASFEQSGRDATLTEPLRVRTNNWTVTGVVEKMRVVLPKNGGLVDLYP